MGSASATLAPTLMTAALNAITHYALWKPAGEQANAAGYIRQAKPTITASGDADEESTAELVFTASGGAWTGPWYLVATNSGTYGAGDIIAICVDNNGDPLTVRDSLGAEITSLADGSSITIPAGSLTFAIPTSAVPAP